MGCNLGIVSGPLIPMVSMVIELKKWDEARCIRSLEERLHDRAHGEELVQGRVGSHNPVSLCFIASIKQINPFFSAYCVNNIAQTRYVKTVCLYMPTRPTRPHCLSYF